MIYDPNGTRVKTIQDFPSLMNYLRDELEWPIESNDADEITFDYSPEELGFDKSLAVKVNSIKQLRPLVTGQPWGIFYVDFEPKRLPVGALRRLLRSLVVKKRGGGDGSQATWNLDDLLFISFHGEESDRTVAFAHFREREKHLPQLRTFYWDKNEREFRGILESLRQLKWPEYAESPGMTDNWRKSWGSAFRTGHGEVIRDSKALSKQLARVALKIKQHVSDLLETEDPTKGPLHRLFNSFKIALLHDLTEQRFADVLAQTFAYGLLAAKAEIGTHAELQPGHLAEQIPSTNPLLRDLFEEFQELAGPGLDKLDEELGDLGVDVLVDLLNSVDVDEVLKNFGRTTKSGIEDPVVHFYEEFLEDYDKQEKDDRGVFYTPKPVVSFIVRSVHEILQKQFKLADGIADTSTWAQVIQKHPDLQKPEGIRGDEPFVQILDPAVGTGTFLETCIQLIYDTMAAKWSKAGQDVKTEWNRYVPQHLLPRLHGFELMMAPYVVCHMKLGLRLKELGYDFQSGERLRVYLTNALEPGLEQQSAITGLVAAIAHEAHAAAADKREKRFTVVIGNPPYAGHSANNSKNPDGSLNFIGGLIADYYKVDGGPLGERNPKYLQDDYVKFIRLGQFHVGRSMTGVLSYISNNGYLDNPTFKGMRQHLSCTFEDLSILNLHGSSKKKETASDGLPDDNVFNIMQGVAIGIFVSNSQLHRASTGATHGAALHRDAQYADLYGSRQKKFQLLASSVFSQLATRALQPATPHYLLIPQSGNLLMEYQQYISIRDIFSLYTDGFKTHRDHFAIAITPTELIERLDLFRSNVSDVEVAKQLKLNDNSDWSLAASRVKLKKDGKWKEKILECTYRPFDRRTCYFSTIAMDRPRKELAEHVAWADNLCLGIGRQGQAVDPENWQLAICSDVPIDTNAFRRGGVQVFPLWLYPSLQSLENDESRKANFSQAYVDRLRAACALNAIELPEQSFAYIYSIVHSPTFRYRYAEFLRIDFPRIPLPVSDDLFSVLSAIGRTLIDYHLLQGDNVDEAPASYSGVPEVIVGKTLYESGSVIVDDAKKGRFTNVSDDVWKFAIGGYQPAQKWLKDRKGRILTEADIRHYEKMIFSIGETIRIMNEIDEIIQAHGGWPHAFVASKEPTQEE